MRWIIFLLLVSVSICSQPDVYGQNFSSAELKKYPDIAYRERAFQLFRLLLVDVRGEKRLPSSRAVYQKMDQTVTNIGLELIEAGVFMALDKPLREDRLARLSPAAKAFYDYYRQALPHNPIFRDVFKSIKQPELDSIYQSYKRQKHTEDEWLAS